MKHTFKITLILATLFLLAQLIGLYIVNQSMGERLAFGIERAQFAKETGFIYIFLIIIIVTILALLLARFKAHRLWKFWFFLSIVIILTIALNFFVNQYIAFIIALLAAYYKIVKPNLLIHNLSELFLYGGLAILFVNSLSILSISILIILIAIYDMYAVWKSKHMIKLAKFQTKLKIFTGLLIPYKYKNKGKMAMLGGGDIGFPLLFAAVVFNELGPIALIIPLTVSLSLFLLLLYSKKDKFYPAMPYLGAGCFIGYFIALIALML